MLWDTIISISNIFFIKINVPAVTRDTNETNNTRNFIFRFHFNCFIGDLDMGSGGILEVGLLQTYFVL